MDGQLSRSAKDRLKKYVIWQEGMKCPFTLGVLDILSNGGVTKQSQAQVILEAIKGLRDFNEQRYGVPYCPETGGGKN